MMDMGKKSYFAVSKIFWTFCCCSSTSRFLQSFFHGWLNSQTRQARTHSVKNKKKNVPTRAHLKWLSLHFTLANREKNCFSIARALLHRSMMCANLEGWGHLLSDAWRQRRKTLFAHCSQHCDDFSIRFLSTVNLFRADLNLMNIANMRLTLAECEVQRISLNVELHRRELIGMVKNTQQKLCWDCRERSRSPSRRAMKWKTHIFKQLIRNFKDPCC